MAARDPVPAAGYAAVLLAEQRLEAEHTRSARPVERAPEHSRQQDAIFLEAASPRDQTDLRTLRSMSQQMNRIPTQHLQHLQHLQALQTLQRVGGDAISLEGASANLVYLVQSINASSRTIVMGDPRRDLCAWIGDIPPQGVYEDARRQWMTDTCRWLEDREGYREWMRDSGALSKSKYLWLCGDAGFGKTVTCAWVVDRAELAGNKVVHFFFTSRKPATQQPSAILRAWLTQIVYKDDAARAVAADIRSKKPSPSATTEDLWYILERILAFDPAYTLVIDGLDECGTKDSEATYQVGDARVQFLQRLMQVTAEKGCRVFMTSRRLNEIDILWQNGMSTGAGNAFNKYEISSSDTDADISLLARSVVDQLAEFPEDVRSELSSQICKRAKGMFLMVRLTENQLSPAHTEQEVKDIIEDTPPDLENVFKRELQRIYAQEKRLRARAIRILTWTLCAQRPLTIGQLSEALIVDATTLGSGPFPERNLNKINKPYVTLRVQALCGSLIRIVEGKTGTELAHQTVQFSHGSIGEYLAGRSYNTMPSDSEIGSLEGFLDHEEIAQICLRYLLYDDFSGGRELSRFEVLQLLKKRPFLGYAAMHWHDHFQQASDSPRARELVEALFHPEKSQWKTWASVYEFHDRVLAKGKKPPAWAPSSSPLYYAAILGDSRLVNFLLSQGVEIDTLGGRYGNALGAAAYHCQEDIVRTLLAEGADINAKGGKYTTTLMTAAAAAGTNPSSINIVKMLLEEGADIAVMDIAERSALHHAAMAGSLPILEKVISNWKTRYSSRPIGDLLDMADVRGYTALHMSASKVNTAMVKCLLEHGAQVDIHDGGEATPLFEAIRRGREDIVRLLLQHGADVHWTTKDGATTLYAASQLGYVDIVQLLIKKKVEIDTVAADNSTALFIAAANGHKDVVQLLADNGADVHVLGGPEFITTVFAAAEKGHRDVVQFLLSRKVSVDTPVIIAGETALLAAVSHGHAQVAQLLIDHGADVRAKKRNGATLLHQVSHEDIESAECIDIALKTDIPIDAVTESGHTALFDALWSGQGKWARRLIEQGASLQMINDAGGTMLHGLCRGPKDDEELGKMLIDAEIDINAAMDDGCSALMLAAFKGHPRLAKLLIAHSADLELMYNDGAQAIHAASQEGYTEIIRALLDAGANVNALRNDGATPLILAVTESHRLAAQLLIERGATIKDKTKKGASVLEMACGNDEDDDELVSQLLQSDGDIKSPKGEGLALLEYAIFAKNERVAGLLLHEGAATHFMTNLDIETVSSPFVSGNEDAALKFLEEGLDVNISTASGHNLLFHAAFNGHKRIVKLLLRFGANLHQSQPHGVTPLYAACQEGHLGVVRILLDQDIDINAKRDDIGWTPLIAAARDGHRGIVKLLLERKADPCLKGNDGYTVMHAICQCSTEWVDVVELLLRYPGLRDDATEKLRTPLFDAARNGHRKIVKLLIESGADAFATTFFGSEVIHAAAEKGHVDIVRYLLDMGLNMNRMRYPGETAILVAAINERLDIVRLLLSRYANIYTPRDDGLSVLNAICVCRNEELEIVKILLDRGVNFEYETDDGRTALFEAALRGHTRIVQELINRGANIHTMANDGTTPLFAAAQNGHEDVVKLLLECSTLYIDDTNRDGWGPILTASRYGHMRVMNLLLDAGANVDVVTDNSVNALHAAVESGKKRAINLILSKGIDINARTNSGQTALSIAASNGDASIVRLLLKRGADLHSVADSEDCPLLYLICNSETENVNLAEYVLKQGADKDSATSAGRTACFAAALRGHEKLIRLLIEHGADVCKAEASGGTPLHATGQKGNANIAAMLIDHYPDLNIFDKDSWSPLLLAAANGHKDLVRLLLKRGADPDITSMDGYTILHAACQSNIEHPDLLEELLEISTISKDAETKDQRTPLLLAALHGHNRIAEILMKAGANPNTATDDGATALYAASVDGHYRMVQLLLSKGMDINAARTTGATPLFPAAWNGRRTIAKYLVEKGADLHLETREKINMLHAVTLADTENEAMARILLDKEVEIDAITDKGETAIMIAARQGFERLALLFLERGARLDTPSGRTALFSACESEKECALLVTKILEKTDKMYIEPDAGRTPLFEAASRGHLLVVELLLKWGADVHTPCENGRLALGIACRAGHLGIARLLLKYGAQVDAVDNDGWTAAELTISRGERQILQLLLDYGAKLKHLTPEGGTYLHKAAYYKEKAITETLLKAGTDDAMEILDDDGETPIHIAVNNKNLGILRMLLSYPFAKHAINIKSSSQKTALFMACSIGNRKMVKLLLAHNPQLDLATLNGTTALQIAIYEGHTDIINDLLDAGADTSPRTATGLNALLLAYWKRRVEVVDRLMDLVDKDPSDFKGKSGLHYTLEAGDLTLVKKIVGRGNTPHVETIGGRNAFHFAAKSENVACMDYLHSLGVSLEKVTRKGRLPMHKAAKIGRVENLQWLYDHGSKIDVRDNFGVHPLHLAAQFGHVEAVHLLLRLGADINAKTKEDVSALYLSAWHGHLEVVKALLDSSATLNAEEGGDVPILHAAAVGPNPEVVYFLIERGLDPLHKPESGWTTVLSATEAGHLKLAKYLVEKGVDPLATDQDKTNALHLAAEEGNIAFVEWLIELGADLAAEDDFGRIALHEAAGGGHLDVVKRLLYEGADLHARDRSGNNIAHRSAETDQLDVLEFAAAEGVNLSTTSKKGHTPLHVAAQRGHADIVKYLLKEQFVDPNRHTLWGTTPLRLAVNHSHILAIKELVQYGADPDILDSFGHTCLDSARNCPPIFDALLREGETYKPTPEAETRVILQRSIRRILKKKKDKLPYHTLGRLLLGLDDTQDALIAFEQHIDPESDKDEPAHSAYCDACRSVFETNERQDIRGQRFVCRSCPNFDLCADCMVSYTRYGFRNILCQGHKFLEVPGLTWKDRAKDVVDDEGRSKEAWLEALQERFKQGPEDASSDPDEPPTDSDEESVATTRSSRKGLETVEEEDEESAEAEGATKEVEGTMEEAEETTQEEKERSTEKEETALEAEEPSLPVR